MYVYRCAGKLYKKFDTAKAIVLQAIEKLHEYDSNDACYQGHEEFYDRLNETKNKKLARVRNWTETSGEILNDGNMLWDGWGTDIIREEVIF